VKRGPTREKDNKYTYRKDVRRLSAYLEKGGGPRASRAKNFASGNHNFHSNLESRRPWGQFTILTNR